MQKPFAYYSMINRFEPKKLSHYILKYTCLVFVCIGVSLSIAYGVQHDFFTHQAEALSLTPPIDSSVYKQLYLGNGQFLDRIDPVATNDLSTERVAIEYLGPQDEQVLDSFSNISFSGNDGSKDYLNSWQQIGEIDGPENGVVQVVNSVNCPDGNCLRFGGFDVDLNNNGANRAADLSNASQAFFNFKYFRTGVGENTSTVNVDIFNNEDSTWVTLKTYALDTFDLGVVSESIDIFNYVSANTQIRFVGTGTTSALSSWMYIDDIEIAYATIGGTNTVDFMQSPALCDDLAIVENELLTASTYVNILSGTMSANPDITASINYGGNNIVTLINPNFDSTTNLITWSQMLPAPILVPAGQIIDLQIASNEDDLEFEILYDSETYPSKIDLPVSTFINIISFDLYNAPYPGGNIIASAIAGDTVYPRALVTDPFGFEDITALEIDITGVNTIAASVDSTNCTRTYEHEWITPESEGVVMLNATAKEGFENTVTSVENVNIDICSPGIEAPVFDLGTVSTRCHESNLFFTAFSPNATSIRYSLDDASIAAGHVIDSFTAELFFAPDLNNQVEVIATAEGCNGPVFSRHLINLSIDCPPVANDDYLVIDQGEASFLNTLSNDSDFNNDIDLSSFSIVQEPTSGNLTTLEDGKIIYTPNGSFVGQDTFVYQVCNSIPSCDTASVFIFVEENFLDPCGQANKTHTFYLPFPEEDLYSSLRSATACPENLGTNVRSIISIKTPYPTIFIKYDHWEDGYEDDLNQPIQPSTEIWGDGDLTNGAPPGIPNDILFAGSSIIIDNTFNYVPPRNQSQIVYDGKDKLVTSSDISISKITGDNNVFGFQSAKTAIYDINRYGTSFTVPFGEDLGGEFNYTALFIAALEDSTSVTVDVNADGVIDANDEVQILNQGEVLFVDGNPNEINQANDIKSGATVIANKKVGLDVLFGGIDCFGTRNINLLPAAFYSNVYYSPVPTVSDVAPAKVYFYNTYSTDITITWTSSSATGTIDIPAESTESLILPNSNTAYKFENLGGESFVAIEVIDADGDGSAFDWAFSLIGLEQLSDFTSIAWAPGSSNFTRNDGPIWVTPTGSTTLYIKNDGDITSGGPFISPCGRAYDLEVDINELELYQIRDNADNDQSGTAIYTCDSTAFYGVYGEDPSTALVANPSMDVGTNMQPMCSDRLILANEDFLSTLPGVAIDIPVLDNDDAFLVTIDSNSISFDGLIPPINGTVTLNSDNSIIYTPDPGFEGTDIFEYRLCAQEDDAVCDIAMVTILVVECSATPITVVINGVTYQEFYPDNGMYDNEANIPYVNVDLYLDDNGNGIIDLPFDTLITSTTSNISGHYSFPKRVLGNYIVKVNPMDGQYIPAILDTGEAQFLAFDTCVNNLYLGVTSLLTAIDDVVFDEINNAQTIDVLSNDIGNPDTATISTAGLQQAMYGAVNLNTNGTFTYQPNFEFVGIDSFEYAVCSATDVNICDTAMVVVSVSCPSASGQNMISGTVFIDANQNEIFEIAEGGQENAKVRLYDDFNQNGVLDPGENAIDSVLTSTNGEYAFVPIITDFPVSFILKLDRVSIPGTFLTTDNIETATFTSIGQSECVNNFGIQNCIGSCYPEANDDEVNIDMNTSVAISVLSNDFDADGDLDTTAVTIPVGGMFPSNGLISIDSTNGIITYIPNPSFNGVDSFEYQVCDLSSPTALCDIALVTISVSCPTIPGQNIISGFVFDDINGNRFFDNEETGGASIKVRLYRDRNEDGLLDNSDVLVDSMLSNADGSYSFSPMILGSSQTIIRNVPNGVGDAEENLTNGAVTTTTSNDLDIVTDGANAQLIGIRFSNLTIPPGSIIENAYLEFYADGFHFNAANFMIYGEDVDNALEYNTSNFNISSRQKTAGVNWSNVPFWLDNNTYATPDLSPIIQTIIDRTNWVSGNNIAFMIDGSGLRRAEAFESNEGAPPRLIIQYATNIASYITELDETTLPIGTEMTTDLFEETSFAREGESDCSNNFGFRSCPGGCAPVAMDDNAITETNYPVVIDVIVNDTDANQDIDSTSVNVPAGLIQPANGTITIDSNTGEITYLTNTNFIGIDSFEYIVCDLSNPTPKCDTALVKVYSRYCNTGDDQVKISGQLFLDKNDNGINDDDGTGLAGVTMQLFSDLNCDGIINGADAMIKTKSTDMVGNYEFIETVGFSGFPYCYIVQLENTTLPLGYLLTTTSINVTAFSDPATCNKNIDVGTKIFIEAEDDIASMLTYSGFATVDVINNDNGNFSLPVILTQPPLAIATVLGDGTIRFVPDDDSVETNYSFTYQICSLDDISVCDTAMVAVTVSDCVAGISEKTIRGKIFLDDNENGINNAENGIENISINIYEDVNKDGLVDVGDVLLSTEITDASGDYIYTFTIDNIQVEDQFSTVSYAGGEGPWATDWIESDPYGSPGPIGNYVSIDGEELSFHWAYQNVEWIQRSVDLSAYREAILSFDWRTVRLDANESMDIQVSTDGLLFTSIGTFTGNQTGSFIDTISNYISSNTTIRFMSTGNNWENREFAFFDNILIRASNNVSHFVIETNGASYPPGFYLTTDNIETATIFAPGECESPNNFGLNFLDFDEDLIPDPVDLDDDNDGIPDLVESPFNPLADVDADEVPAYLDDDDTDDAIGNFDGLVQLAFDLDADNIPNHFDLDADNDGCHDTYEAGHNQITEADHTIGGVFGLNGLSSLVENNDTPLATINYSPTQTTAGIYDFLNDAISSGCNEPPLAISDINATEINIPVSGNLLTNDQDFEGDSLIINTSPMNVIGGTVFIGINGQYTFTPITGFSGEASFLYELCDNATPSLCDTAMVNIDVIDISNPVNARIAGMEDHFITENDNLLSADLLENDKDPAGDSLVINMIPLVLPENGTLTIYQNGRFDYMPNTNFKGVDQFTYEVCSATMTSVCDTVGVTMNILEGNGQNNIYATDDVNLGNIGDTLTGNTILNDNDPSVGILTVNTTPVFAPQNGTVTLDSSGNYFYFADPEFSGNDRFVYQVCDSGSPMACDSATVYLTVLDNRVTLDFKVFLQGALFAAPDTLMRADLVNQGLVPLEQPYTTSFSPLFGSRFVHTTGGDEVTTDTVLNANAGTPDGIVDWVFIELRDPTDSVTVIRTISALVQRDGDIVNAKNGGSLHVTNLFGQFFVLVKHRNHLGAMTAAPISVINKVAKADFTTMTDADLYHHGEYDGLEQTSLNDKKALWAGNANADDKSKYDGSFNDRIILTAEIINAPNNTDRVLNYNDAIGYFQGDINMDGKAKYDGFLNDRILLQYIILTYTNNSLLLNNYDKIIEQIK